MFPSDHPCVFIDALVYPVIQISSRTVEKKYFNENSTGVFVEAISMTPSI